MLHFGPVPLPIASSQEKKRKQRQKAFWIEAMDNSDEN